MAFPSDDTTSRRLHEVRCSSLQCNRNTDQAGRVRVGAFCHDDVVLTKEDCFYLANETQPGCLDSRGSIKPDDAPVVVDAIVVASVSQSPTHCVDKRSEAVDAGRLPPTKEPEACGCASVRHLFHGKLSQQMLGDL